MSAAAAAGGRVVRMAPVGVLLIDGVVLVRRRAAVRRRVLQLLKVGRSAHHRAHDGSGVVVARRARHQVRPRALVMAREQGGRPVRVGRRVRPLGRRLVRVGRRELGGGLPGVTRARPRL